MDKTDHEHIVSLLPLYAEGVLSAEESDSVKRHLATCNDCQQQLLFMQSIMQTAQTLPSPKPPENFHANLSRKLGEVHVVKKRYLFGRRATSLVAACFVLAVCGVSYFHLPTRERYAQNEEVYVTAEETSVPTVVSEETELPQITEILPAETDTPQEVTAKRSQTKNETAPKKIVATEKQHTENREKPQPREQNSEIVQEPVAGKPIAETTNDEVQSQSLQSVVESESQPIVAAENENDVRAASGGGGGARSRKAFVYTVTVKEEVKDAAEDILSGLATENGAYILAENPIEVVNALENLNGFISLATEEAKDDTNTLYLNIQ